MTGREGFADLTVLDDPAALALRDPQSMLREVASAGSQVRQALVACQESGLGAAARLGRPRAVVVTGMGGSGIAGHVLQAAAGPECPVPVERVRGWGLPAWVGSEDLVLAVSSSGRTAETMACAQMALERGSRLVVVAAPGSPLVELAERAGVPWVPVPDGRPPRANLWALSVPLLVAAHDIGIIDAAADELSRVADLLDELAQRCGPDQPLVDNPAKQLAADLAGSLPMIWGSSDLAGIAAYRLLCQLAENAKYPSVNGVLPEALHNQVVTFAASGTSGPTIRLLLLRDSVEDSRVATAAVEAERLARELGVEVSSLAAAGVHPLERMASLCAIGDFASVYLGLVRGIDPTPITPIETLKLRLAAAVGGGVP
jgi:glucose/mannose-6-phosphate isomerase